MKPTILIVDDDEEIRSQLRWALTEDYDVYEADDRPSARTAFTQNKPLVTLLDLGLPPQPAEPDEGFAALNDLLGLDRTAKIIMVTGQGERINALRTVGEGAFDFLSKPVDMDELKIILKRAVHVAQLEREYRQLQQAVASDAFEGMIGIGPRMQAVFSTIRKLGGTDAPVLILGESGTGKEVTALAIHRQSLRCNGPFIPINCGAIPETLLESELFGYEKGAFTGAHTQRKGRIESANGGTLFLDEIGELPVALQVKLLRFLQEQTIERIGGRTSHVVDTRIITATNADLKKALAENLFREDLYYRIAVVVLQLPPLRRRPEDIPTLARTFLRKYATEAKRPNLTFSQATLRLLQQHSWPGNVRELENRIKRAVVMAEGRYVTAADLELTLEAAVQVRRTLKDVREAAERQAVLAALKRNKWRIAPAASDLDVSRPTIYELMEKLNIQKPEADDDAS
ncbi:MAG TPA: PEP-CTERM-box response regulator transcription factor [Verrucomicrobiota bacterium]|jgi:two-component system NtrC family response regulator|nr:MAG: Transcriptional regulatory protein ZraR [Verrucomicrobia bacterium ADurb.Bin118]HPY30787.1 PEP-CTERM-box response regulator transcription factor [Verrucomicrobiota bacterium]HQB17121.1 PEP-CTERM-box response regulator transcription factor [Verrucomicrobiota bacterium]